MRPLGPIIEKCFALFSILFMFGGVAFLFRSPGAPETPLLQFFGAMIGTLALLGLLLTPNVVHRMVVNYWPALIAPAFAVFSIVWANDPLIAARRSGSLVLSTTLAMWLAERFDHRALLKLVVTVAVILCLLCWYVVLLQPRIGIHQADDLIGELHAGAWRGVFPHKNDFGRAIALTIVIFAVAMLAYRRYALVFVLAILQALALIVGSRSSQAVLLAGLPSAVILLIYVTRDMTTAQRSMIIAITAPLALVAYMLRGFFFQFLLGLLGKDETLTGRTEIWTAVIDSSRDIALFGGGYGTGWEVIFDSLTALGVGVGHAHNGYLDLMVDLGITGVLLAVLFMLVLAFISFRNIFSAQRVELATLALGFAIFYIVGNWAGSFLMLHNSIYWVLPVACFCVLSRLTARARASQADLWRLEAAASRQPGE